MILRSVTRRRFVLACCICLLLSLAQIGGPLFASLILYTRYEQDLRLAYKGAHDLQAATIQFHMLAHDPFNSQLIDTMQAHFTAASTVLKRVVDDLSWLPGEVSLLPISGQNVGEDQDLAITALETAQLGQESCAILRTLTAKLHNALRSTQAFTLSDLDLLRENSKQARALLEDITLHIKQLQAQRMQSSALDTMIHTLSGHLPLISNALHQFDETLSVAPLLLGITNPAHYLIELLDTSEMQPGGGFVGNYGLITIAGGRLISVSITDSYLLDNRQHSNVSIPPAYSWFMMAKNWSLHYSNLDADFPTSARNAEMIYQKESGKLQFQGVIAITPALLEDMLVLTGSIPLPEYHEVITSQNLVDRIHYHQLIEEGHKQDTPSPDGYSSLRKHFTALLSEAFVYRLRTLPDSTLTKIFPLLVDALHTKDLQVFFNATRAENMLHIHHLDSSIQSPSPDNLLVVQTNISPSKINRYLITTIHDQVILDSTGTAIHTASITFAWTKENLKSSDVYGSLHYLCYLRIYLPVNSGWLTQPDWQAEDAGAILGRSFWGGYYAVNYPTTGKLQLRWIVKYVISHVVSKEENTWHYQYELQRQAGTLQNIDIHIRLLEQMKSVSTCARGIVHRIPTIDLVELQRFDETIPLDFTCTS